MAGTPWEPDDDIGAGAPPDVLARAKRVGPDFGPDDPAGPDAEPAREPEPWELPPVPPPRPQLRERSAEDVFARVRELTLPEARAFLRAYQSIPRSELDLGAWAPGGGRAAAPDSDPPSVDEIAKGRAALRGGAVREARAQGAEIDPEPIAQRAREVVVEALSHAMLRGGEIEEATVAAEVAVQDAALALTARSWISEWRFQELVEPWVAAYTVLAKDGQSFDALGAVALALAVLALATYGLGRSSINASDAAAVVFAVLAALLLVVRWRIRRRPVTA